MLRDRRPMMGGQCRIARGTRPSSTSAQRTQAGSMRQDDTALRQNSHEPAPSLMNLTHQGGAQLAEKIGMCPGPFQTQFVRREAVSQQPVWFEVAVATSNPPAQQRVILIFSRKGFASDQNLDRGLELADIFAPLLLPLNVFLKLRCLAEPHPSQLA